MTMTRLDSSSIAAADYDVETRKLRLEFTSGRLYDYSDVPATIHEALIAAPSAGKYFHAHIKGRYKCTKVS